MADDSAKKEEEKKDEAIKFEEEKPVVTKHALGALKYTATAGRMPVFDEKGGIDAQVFYIAYVRDGVRAKANRPVTFVFNGGPGSPAVWLHLGAIGPKRVKMDKEGFMPPAPYRLADNASSWIDETDLVFIDPVGTGYSRAKDDKTSEKAWSLKGDIESVAEFVRMWLVRNDRWSSPLYLAGESYGTTRAAGLAGYLVDRGIGFNGIVLISSILNFQTARFVQGNDLPYVLFLPTYAATAWYHKRLDRSFSSLSKTLDAARKFAGGPYAEALMKGDALTAKERMQTVKDVARFTGLSETYVDHRNFRIQIQGFCKELLRDKKRVVGRLDSRFKGINRHVVGEEFDHDPSMSGIMPPYNACFNDYVRTGLGYRTDLVYQVFKGIKKPWDWGSAGEGHPDTSDALRDAMSKNPHMKVLVCSGFYDLATPFFATEYTLAHMGLDPELAKNVSVAEYESGHMMYIHEPSLKKFKSDCVGFIKKTKNV
jgi:carboxypeptidase C (cathepsin A)